MRSELPRINKNGSKDASQEVNKAEQPKVIDIEKTVLYNKKNRAIELFCHTLLTKSEETFSSQLCCLHKWLELVQLVLYQLMIPALPFLPQLLLPVVIAAELGFFVTLAYSYFLIYRFIHWLQIVAKGVRFLILGGFLSCCLLLSLESRNQKKPVSENLQDWAITFICLGIITEYISFVVGLVVVVRGKIVGYCRGEKTGIFIFYKIKGEKSERLKNGGLTVRGRRRGQIRFQRNQRLLEGRGEGGKGRNYDHLSGGPVFGNKNFYSSKNGSRVKPGLNKRTKKKISLSEFLGQQALVSKSRNDTANAILGKSDGNKSKAERIRRTGKTERMSEGKSSPGSLESGGDLKLGVKSDEKLVLSEGEEEKEMPEDTDRSRHPQMSRKRDRRRRKFNRGLGRKLGRKLKESRRKRKNLGSRERTSEKVEGQNKYY